MKLTDQLKDEKIVGSPVKHLVALTVILFIFWILLSGKMEAKYLFYGIVTSFVSAWVCLPLLTVKSIKGDKKFFAFDIPVGKYVAYWIWLIKEVVKANIDIAKVVLQPEMPINPQMISFKMPMDNPMSHVTLANSITLTPGTITISVEQDGEYIIHALTDGAAEGLLAGDMQRKVAKVHGEKHEYVYVEETQGEGN